MKSLSIKTQAQERLGVLIYHLEESFSAYFSLKKFLKKIFVKGKMRTDLDVIYEIGNPTLGALSYFHVGVELGGIWI